MLDFSLTTECDVSDNTCTKLTMWALHLVQIFAISQDLFAVCQQRLFAQHCTLYRVQEIMLLGLPL